MAAKINWHRYCTTLRHCHAVYTHMTTTGKNAGSDSAATWYQNSCRRRNAMAGWTVMPTATDVK